MRSLSSLGIFNEIFGFTEIHTRKATEFAVFLRTGASVEGTSRELSVFSVRNVFQRDLWFEAAEVVVGER